MSKLLELLVNYMYMYMYKYNYMYMYNYTLYMYMYMYNRLAKYCRKFALCRAIYTLEMYINKEWNYNFGEKLHV